MYYAGLRGWGREHASNRVEQQPKERQDRDRTGERRMHERDREGIGRMPVRERGGRGDGWRETRRDSIGEQMAHTAGREGEMRWG